MSFFAKLAVLISANTAEFKAGLDDATKATKKFEAEQRRAMREAAKAAKELEANLRATAQALTGIALVAGGAMRWADEIVDTAQSFDITVKSLMAMQGALTLAGGKADNFGTMLQKLANNAEAAKEGTDKARESFAKLGITGREVEDAAPDELFARVAQALSEIEDPIKRNALAFEVLGKAAKGVNWKSFWEDYSSGKTTTEGVSEAIEEGAKAWDNLGRAGKAALEGILILIRPLTAFINWMSEKVDEAKKRPLTGSLMDAEFGGGFGMAGDTSFLDQREKAPTAATAAAAKKTGGYKKASEREQAEKSATEAVRQQTREYLRQIEVMIQKEELQSKLLNMTTNEKELAQAMSRIEQERANLVVQAEREIRIEQEKGEKANRSKIQALKDQIELINFAKENEKQAIEEIIKKRQEEQASFEAGWNRAYRQYAEDAQNYSRMGEQAFKSVASNMEKALDQFVATGKLSFKNLAQSIIQDLIRIQLKANATKLFNMAVSSFGGSFGGSSGTGAFDMGGSGGAYADGGRPPLGEVSLVGERGPELFVPDSPGTVIPNNRLGEALGNTTNITNNYIDAIDTKSFEDRLLGSHNAVWAANQYANKSLATGRMRT